MFSRRKFIHAIQEDDGARVGEMLSGDTELAKTEITYRDTRYSALEYAIVYKLDEAVAAMVKTCPGILGEEPKALLTASSYGNAQTVRVLIDAGASLEERDHRNETALHRAVGGGRYDVVQMLLETGADVTAMNDRGETPAEAARKKGIAIDALMEADMQAKCGWEKSDADTICVSYETAGRILTESFNFKARQRITFSKNIDDGAEAMFRENFTDIENRDVITQAAAQLLKQGGNDHTGANLRKIKQPVSIAP